MRLVKLLRRTRRLFLGGGLPINWFVICSRLVRSFPYYLLLTACSLNLVIPDIFLLL